MLDYKLFKQEFAELCAAHRWALNVREAYRINAVILLGNGRTAADIAVALLIDTVTVCTYFNRYKKCGIGELLRINYVGDEAFLDDDQLSVLDTHLQELLHLTAVSVALRVEERWGVYYDPSWVAGVLCRLGYVYKKPKRVLGKADAAAQETFLKD